MVFLEVENVTAGYGNGPDILKGLTLKIEQGRTCCIIGPNGAGKSTLFRIMASLIIPDAGHCLMHGHDVV